MLKLAIILNILFIAVLIYTFTPNREEDKELKPYLDHVISKIESKCHNRYIHPVKFWLGFERLDHYVIGTCYPNKYNMSIRVDPLFWNFSDERERQVLMAHEAFHCFLGADHVHDIHNFMNEWLPPVSSEDLEKQMNEYLDKVCK